MEESNRDKYRHNISRIYKCIGLDQWIPPPPGEVQLDVDASENQAGNAACGGLVGDEQADWVIGLQQKIWDNINIGDRSLSTKRCSTPTGFL